MPTELIVAEIQQAFFECRANFKELITIFWSGGRQAEIINAIQKALVPWNVDLENVAWQQGKEPARSSIVYCSALAVCFFASGHCRCDHVRI
jgi:hypothetical protein